MATDIFMDLLTPTAARAVNLEQSRRTARSINAQAQAIQDKLDGKPLAGPRPDFADDIDRLVLAMVSDGSVVWDGEAKSYRRPNVRRWRFA